MTEPIPVLPSEPRTTTNAYRFPPATPSPPADRCNRDDLLLIAADGAYDVRELLCSSSHVAALCRLIGVMADELGRCDEQIRTGQQQLASAHGRLVAEMEYSSGLHQRLAQSNLENDWLRRENLRLLPRTEIVAGFERLTLTVTGRSYSAVNAELARQVDGMFDDSDGSVPR